VGEIWVAGPSVANGYWRRPEETTASFGAELGAGATRWLRTGDLGFFEVGELFVTGRLKDLIIVRGRNVYPQDVELTVERAHAALRPGCGAAFAVPHDGTDWLVVVHELERRFVGERRRQTPPPDLPARAPADRREPRPDIAAFSPPADDPAPTVRLEGVVEAVCQAVSARHDLQPFAVVLLRAGTVPKTTSGKVQRYACRTAFLDGSLDVLHEWRRRLTAHSDLRGLRSVAPAPVVREPDAVSAWLAARLAKLLRLDAAKLDPASAITRYGIDSLQAVELTNLVQQVFGVSLPLERVLGGPALGELAAWICEEGATSAAPILPADAAGDDAPSFAQQRMWFLWSLEPESPSYHVAASVEVSGPLDVAALGRALDELRLRHETLRTTFHWLGDRLVARVRPWEPEPLDVRDLSGLAPVERERLRAEIVTEEPRRPFDLERGPLMRCLVLRLAEREHVVVLTLHHIVSDGWSLGVLADELSRGYRAAAGRAGGEPEPLPIQYRDFARWERELFQSGRLAPSVEYWRRRLAGAPARLELPRDRPRPPVQSHRGGRLEIALPPELGDRLHALSRAQGATLYMTLLAGFYVLMHRYTAEEDLVLGCVTAGRGRPEIERLIGFFANTLALRTDLGGDPTFRELMGRVARTTLEAYAHAALPFEHVVEVCNPERDPGRNTLVQVTFVLQNAPLPPVELEDLNLVAELDTGAARFDLLVAVWETPSGLRVSCEYATDLFEASTIHRLARHYERVLEDAVADPDARISALAPALEWQTLPIAVAATFEGRALAAALGAWLDRVHVPAHVRSIPACVSVAALLAADAELAERGAALNVICVRLEDWSPDVPEPADALAAMAREAVRFVEALAAFIRRVGTPCLVALAPPGVKWRDDAELGRRMGAVERDLAHGVARAGALWLELGAGVELYGVTRIEEADGEGAGYAPGAVAAMAACLARRIFSAGVPYRALAVDPVGLLWSEGGPPSGRGPGRVAPPLDRWQQRLGELCVGLAHRGWRLFACARGSEDELRAALRSRPELPLRARHLHGWRANDRGVADNLRDMASEAGLPLSALVYLSASATGCREVRAHCPEILVVELGPDPRENFELARHLWAWSILGDRPASEAPPLAAPAPAGGPSFAAFVERRWTGLAPPMRAEVLRRIAVELRGEAELRRALRAACAVRERRGEPIAPRDALEALIADVWSELLGVDRVGVHDDFFMLGGHSLLIARLASRLQDALGVTLPLGRAFAYRTVSDLAAGLAPTETDRRRLCRTAELVSHVAALSEADAEQELSTRRPPPA
jgi:acyl carrier protein